MLRDWRIPAFGCVACFSFCALRCNARGWRKSWHTLQRIVQGGTSKRGLTFCGFARWGGQMPECGVALLNACDGAWFIFYILTELRLLSLAVKRGFCGGARAAFCSSTRGASAAAASSSCTPAHVKFNFLTPLHPNPKPNPQPQPIPTEYALCRERTPHYCSNASAPHFPMR